MGEISLGGLHQDDVAETIAEMKADGYTLVNTEYTDEGNHVELTFSRGW